MLTCKPSIAPNVKSVNRFLLTSVKKLENKPQLLGSYCHIYERQQGTAQHFSDIRRVTKDNQGHLKSKNFIIVRGKNSS